MSTETTEQAPDPRRILDLPLPENDSGATTVRGYLISLLEVLWRSGDDVHPFGNSGWQHDLYHPMADAGLARIGYDEDGYATEPGTHASYAEADELILAAIRALGEPQAAEAGLVSTAPGDGRFAVIAFMGHNEYTGYVTEVVKHGQPAYRVDLPERLWGGNPDAWVEYAASAWFSERPRSEESVRRAWESQVRAAAERARREAEWARAREQRALEVGGGEDGPADDEDDAAGGWS